MKCDCLFSFFIRPKKEEATIVSHYAHYDSNLTTRGSTLHSFNGYSSNTPLKTYTTITKGLKVINETIAELIKKANPDVNGLPESIKRVRGDFREKLEKLQQELPDLDADTENTLSDLKKKLQN